MGSGFDVALSTYDRAFLAIFAVSLAIHIRYYLRYRRSGTLPALTAANYERLPPAWPLIVALWAGLVFASDMVRQSSGEGALKRFLAEAALDNSKALFLIYAAGFFSMWCVYFASRSNVYFLHVQSLRGLLKIYSAHW